MRPLTSQWLDSTESPSDRSRYSRDAELGVYIDAHAVQQQVRDTVNGQNTIGSDPVPDSQHLKNLDGA